MNIGYYLVMHCDLWYRVLIHTRDVML